MSAVVAVFTAVLVVLTAIGLHQLQHQLERRDYDRHRQD
jgi:hypothetical protein